MLYDGFSVVLDPPCFLLVFFLEASNSLVLGNYNLPGTSPQRVASKELLIQSLNINHSHLQHASLAVLQAWLLSSSSFKTQCHTEPHSATKCHTVPKRRRGSSEKYVSLFFRYQSLSYRTLVTTVGFYANKCIHWCVCQVSNSSGELKRGV